MSRNESAPRGSGQKKDPAGQEKDEAERQENAAQSPAEHEARGFSRDTGYRPSVNQRRHEPLPASRHDERRQEAIVRNEEHSSGHSQAAPAPRARSRRKG
jgi:hypothetical protein